MVRSRPVWMTNHPPSVLWHCWLGHQTCKNRRPYNLYCVGADVKPCSIQSNPILMCIDSLSLMWVLCMRGVLYLIEKWWKSVELSLAASPWFCWLDTKTYILTVRGTCSPPLHDCCLPGRASCWTVWLVCRIVSVDCLLCALCEGSQVYVVQLFTSYSNYDARCDWCYFTVCTATKIQCQK